MVAVDWNKVLATDVERLPNNLDEADSIYELLDTVKKYMSFTLILSKILLSFHFTLLYLKSISDVTFLMFFSKGKLVCDLAANEISLVRACSKFVAKRAKSARQPSDTFVKI